MAAFLAILLAVVSTPAIAEDGPAQLLQIFRDTVKPGKEAAYRAVEEDAALVCARHGFPNPHLAIESLSGPNEVWWLNAFASEAVRQRVTSDFEGNPALVAALEEVTRRRQGLIETPVDLVARFRPDLGHARPWNPAGARFFVVTVTRGKVETTASVFEAPDGTRYFLTPTRTKGEAESAAAEIGRDTRVFAVRPYWGMPATEWITADPEFWSDNPRARPR